MNFPCGFILPSVLASLCLLAAPTMASAQVTGGKTPSHSVDAPSRDDAGSLQKKANEVQARIRANEDDSGQLKRAIKLNEAPLAREILLRNGFTPKDLEDAKINLRTGGGNGGDTIAIFVTCCDPKEITIQRTLGNFTK